MDRGNSVLEHLGLKSVSSQLIKSYRLQLEEMEVGLQSIRPMATYTTYVYTTIYRQTTAGPSFMVPDYCAAELLQYKELPTSNNIVQGGSGLMDPNNPKKLYTCNDNLWYTTDATVTTPTWTSAGVTGVSPFKPTGTIVIEPN